MNSEYLEKLKDPRWQKRRLEIFERDNWTCQNCGNSESTLHVHHRWYAGNPWEAPDRALVTLCENCHKSLKIFGKFKVRKVISYKNFMEKYHES